MSSNFERSQLTKIMISSAPVTAETLDSASYLGLSCTIKEVQFTAGQKQDIDVTTLCCQRQDYWPFFAIFNVRYWSLMLSAFRHFIITDWRGVFCQHSRFAFFL